MSRGSIRLALGMLGGLLIGTQVPSLFGEQWMLSLALIISLNVLQTIMLMALIPDGEDR